MLRESRPVSRRSSLSAIAWPYRWLFALTECGEQRSPAPRLCECVGTDAHSGPAHTDAAPVRVRSVPKPLSILSMRRRRIAGTLGARNLEAGVVSLIVMKLISVLKFRNRYFEITPLFRKQDCDISLCLLTANNQIVFQNLNRRFGTRYLSSGSHV